MEKRSLQELIDTKEPGWLVVQDWLKEATNHYEILPASASKRAEALLDLQVTTRSPMGAIVYETGGILIDHGWLRILGSGHAKLPRSIPEWNLTAQGLELCDVPYVLIADDVIGGFFALDSGALGAPRKVFYLAPESVEWENTDWGYSEFVWFFLTEDLDAFYSLHRGQGWQEEIAAINGDQAIAFYPPLWAEPVLKNGEEQERQRKPVPVVEAYTFALHSAEQLRGVKDGEVIRLEISE